MATVEELYLQLSEAMERGLGDRPVLMATQPRYPLQTTVNLLVAYDPVQDEVDELSKILENQEVGEFSEEHRDEMVDDLDKAQGDLGKKVIFYLTEGYSRPIVDGKELSPYASRDLWSLDPYE